MGDNELVLAVAPDESIDTVHDTFDGSFVHQNFPYPALI